MIGEHSGRSARESVEGAARGDGGENGEEETGGREWGGRAAAAGERGSCEASRARRWSLTARGLGAA